MILDTRLVDAYLNNKSLSDYSGEWIFSDSRRFYYPYCDDKSKAAAAMLYGSVKEQLYDFKPVNSSVYDELFPSWQGETLYKKLKPKAHDFSYPNLNKTQTFQKKLHNKPLSR